MHYLCECDTRVPKGEIRWGFLEICLIWCKGEDFFLARDFSFGFFVVVGRVLFDSCHE